MVNYLWDNIFKKDQTSQNVTSILSQSYMFNTLSQRELKLLQNTVNIRNYKPGETIFQQGELGVGMYIIVEGCVDIYMDDLVSPQAPHKPVFITRLKKSDFFGELALVEEQSRRSASAIASTETTVIGFFKSNLLEISERSPSTGTKIMYRLSMILGRRLKETSSRVADLKRQVEKLRESKT